MRGGVTTVSSVVDEFQQVPTRERQSYFSLTIVPTVPVWEVGVKGVEG